MSSISKPNNRLLSRCARLNSFKHQSDASHARDTRNNTASQRSAAWFSERSHRPRHYPPLWIKIQKNVVPALPCKPIMQRNSIIVVLARMTEKNPRHPDLS
jgi:hypothetical protein